MVDIVAVGLEPVLFIRLLPGQDDRACGIIRIQTGGQIPGPRHRGLDPCQGIAQNRRLFITGPAGVERPLAEGPVEFVAIRCRLGDAPFTGEPIFVDVEDRAGCFGSFGDCRVFAITQRAAELHGNSEPGLVPCP